MWINTFFSFDCTNSEYSDIQIIALFELVKGTCLMQVDFNAILKLEMNVPEVVVISFYSKLVQPIMLLLFVKLTFKSVFVDLLQLCEQWFKSCSFVLVVCPCQTCLQQD